MDARSLFMITNGCLLCVQPQEVLYCVDGSRRQKLLLPYQLRKHRLVKQFDLIFSCPVIPQFQDSQDYTETLWGVGGASKDRSHTNPGSTLWRLPLQIRKVTWSQLSGHQERERHCPKKLYRACVLYPGFLDPNPASSSYVITGKSFTPSVP